MFKIKNWGARSAGITATIMIHLIVLLILFPPTLTQQPLLSEKHSGPVDGEDVVFIDPTIHYNLADTNKATKAFKDAIAQRDMCKDADANFVGLGMRWYSATGIVVHVAKGYSAEKAGLLVGDRIVDPEILAGDFTEADVGRQIALVVERYNVRIRLIVRLEKVCFLKQPHVDVLDF